MDENKHITQEEQVQEETRPARDKGVAILVAGTFVVLGIGLLICLLLPSLSRSGGTTRTAVLEQQERQRLVQEAIQQEATENDEQEANSNSSLP